MTSSTASASSATTSAERNRVCSRVDDCAPGRRLSTHPANRDVAPATSAACRTAWRPPPIRPGSRTARGDRYPPPRGEALRRRDRQQRAKPHEGERYTGGRRGDRQQKVFDEELAGETRATGAEAERSATSRTRVVPRARSRFATLTHETSRRETPRPGGQSAGRTGPKTTRSSGSMNTPRSLFSGGTFARAPQRWRSARAVRRRPMLAATAGRSS